MFVSCLQWRWQWVEHEYEHIYKRIKDAVCLFIFAYNKTQSFYKQAHGWKTKDRWTNRHTERQIEGQKGFILPHMHIQFTHC